MDTTQRLSTTTPLEHLRNVTRAIASLTLKRANNGYLTAEQHKELNELQAKRVKLDREYQDACRWEQARMQS